MAKRKIRKITLEKIHKNLLTISGTITVAVGLINQIIKLFQDYTKKAADYAAMASETASRTMYKVLTPQKTNPVIDFLTNNWQLILIGIGIIILLFVIIFVVDKVKDGD